MSDDSRPKGKDETPAELAEARAARELAEAVDGKPGAAPDEETLATAAMIAAARRPELSEQAKAKLADDLFGPAAPAKKPARWGWAVAASVLVAVGGATLVGGGMTRRAAPAAVAVAPAVAEAGEFHRKAALLIAEMMPQPTAAERAQAIADRARARLQQETAP